MSENSELITPIWTITLEIEPSEDMRFSIYRILTRKPDSRNPTILNTVSNCDMLYEKIQGDLNNHLRQVVNDINRVRQSITKTNHR